MTIEDEKLACAKCLLCKGLGYTKHTTGDFSCDQCDGTGRRWRWFQLECINSVSDNGKWCRQNPGCSGGCHGTGQVPNITNEGLDRALCQEYHSWSVMFHRGTGFRVFIDPGVSEPYPTALEAKQAALDLVERSNANPA